MTGPAFNNEADAIVTIGSGDIAIPPSHSLLHGVTLRPPTLTWNGNAYTGAHLTAIDTQSARQVPGVVNIVVKNNFIGIIASQAQQAAHAKAQVHADWFASQPAAPARSALGHDSSTTPTLSTDVGDANQNLPHKRITHSYSWQTDATNTSAAWAIAHYTDNTITIWVSCTRSDLLKNEIAQVCKLSPAAVKIISNGQIGVNGYDIAVDAALLSCHVAMPVRVQEQPTKKGDAAQVQITLSVVVDDPAPQNGNATDAPASAKNNTLTLSECTITSDRYAVRRPSIAALLCGYIHHYPSTIATHNAYYPTDTQHAVSHPNIGIDANPDGIPGTAQVFAYESYFDELCREQNHDPIQARLDRITDPAGQSLIRSVATQANWGEPLEQNSQTRAGKGFAYAHIVDHDQDPPQQVWSAWVAEVAIDKKSGAIDLTRLTVGHNTQELSTPSPATQVEESVRDAALHLLQGPRLFDSWGAEDNNESATAYPLSLPKVQLVRQSRDVSTELAWNSHAELPAAAAIANAIFDATGVRFRQPPFDTEVLKSELKKPLPSYKKWAYALLGGVAATAAGLLVSALPWRAAMAPLAAIDTSAYSQETINRGRLVATAGDCMVCHTAEGGQSNAGGLALETPFGTVYTTNITPDKETGIGTWSYAAFERAMRQGIHQDGRRLYPAFPYTAFAKITDADMQSLYAYLITQAPVKSETPKTQLAFPYNVRPLLAGWNVLFHRDEQFQPDPSQTTLWNRGAYLVQGAGHCAACHSPRNALGAEKSGEANFLSGGFADGWEAPALNTLSKAPIPWSESELYQYLRTGYSSLHGVAAGPMGPVIQGLAELPESDVRAIAHYLSSLNPPQPATISPALQAATLEDQSKNNQTVRSLAGEGMFEGACAVCHDARGGPPLFGSRPSLALNSNLHSDSPDNVIQVIMHGISKPASTSLGYMPGFKDSMNNQQIQTLLEYMRSRFAPDKPAWNKLAEKIEAIRVSPAH